VTGAKQLSENLRRIGAAVSEFTELVNELLMSVPDPNGISMASQIDICVEVVVGRYVGPGVREQVEAVANHYKDQLKRMGCQ
jgi:hypothetical protein